MDKNAKLLMTLPKDFSKITSGVILNDGKELITGHENGYIVYWKIGDPNPRIILRTISTVNSVIRTDNGDVFVGCNAGDLYKISAPLLKDYEIILPPTNSKLTRVFRLYQPLPSVILLTSTYGKIKILKQLNGEWSFTNILGHHNSVFSLSSYAGNLLATGDYRGEINIWKLDDSSINLDDTVQIGSYVSGLAFITPKLLAALAFNGSVYLFDYDDKDKSWREVYKTDLASDNGVSLLASPESFTVFASTKKEIIKLDVNSQQVYSADVKSSCSMFAGNDYLLILTEGALVKLPISSFVLKPDLVLYQYFKIGLLGDTACGKTTLCNAISTGDIKTLGSTFGRRIWQWNVEPNSTKRIMMNDNGGQEQVIDTLLPLTVDSDIILFLFKKTDVKTFKTAIALHKKIKPLLSDRVKSILVETYTDDRNEAITDEYIYTIKEEEKFDGFEKVSTIDINQVESFKKLILECLDWSEARSASQSRYIADLEKTIQGMKMKGRTSSTPDELQKEFNNVTGKQIYKYHLEFLLQNFSDSGQLDYYPNIEKDKIVFDDPDFNELRSQIPVYVGEHGGIVRWNEVVSKFKENKDYVNMLDKYYISNQISYPFNGNEIRVFSGSLEERASKSPVAASKFIRESRAIKDVVFPAIKYNIPILLGALSDFAINVIDITKKSGVFEWPDKAYLYFEVNEYQSLLESDSLKIKFVVAGPDNYAQKRLGEQFENLLYALYGQPEKTDEVKEK